MSSLRLQPQGACPARTEMNPVVTPTICECTGRLTGTVIGVSATPSPPLSVEGQAHRLIDEATCKERLGSMYIWCGPREHYEKPSRQFSLQCPDVLRP